MMKEKCGMLLYGEFTMKRYESNVSLAFCMVLAGLCAVPRVYAGPATCGTTSSNLELCVRFDNLGYAPALLVDFSRDLTTDPDNPTVTLLRGDDGQGTTYEWRVWCEDASDDPANIGSISGTLAEDYDVKILDANGDPGAATVGEINLNPSDPSNFSRISEGRITGDLTDDLFLQEDDGTPPTGGELDLQIYGNATGCITAPIVEQLYILGNLSGDITVSNKVDGTLEVRGTVDDAVIHIQDTAWETTLLFNTAGGHGEYDFDADLELVNGVPFGVDVEIRGTLLFGSKIDLYGQGVAGTLVLSGGAGDIVNGGDVAYTSWIRLVVYSPDCQNPNRFSGTATFANVNSEIGAEGANVDGLIHVTGDLNEMIPITYGTCQPGEAGHLLPDGRIWVEGDMLFAEAIYVEGDVRGKIQVDGDIVGEVGIMILGDLTGDIVVTGEIASTGSITVDGTLESTGMISVEGSCSGDVTIGEETAASSVIHLAGGLGTTSDITINASEGAYNANGTIKVGEPGEPCPWPVAQGLLAGKITIKDQSEGTRGGDLKGLIDIGCLTGAVTLDIVVEQNMTTTGDIRIRKAATATIDVNGALLGSAKIFVEGLYGGDLTIGTYTGGLSLIHLEGGLDSGGCVKVNASEEDYHSYGTIHVGVEEPYPSPLGDISYYGSIEIEKEADPGTGGGDLNGVIRVVGCHDEEADPLDICIRGDENGTVSLVQTGCDPIVGRDCLGNCPG
jgi:cytoskeletal protein CcmA (bactofilin family)